MFEGDPYRQLEQIFYDCYGCLKRPMQRASKVPAIFARYVWDPEANRRFETHVVSALNEIFFGKSIQILLATDALLGVDPCLCLDPSNLHDDACGVDYFLRMISGELLGGLDVKCSPHRRIKAPNSISAMRNFNYRSYEGIFLIVEAGSTPYELGVFSYMQLLRDYMAEGYDLSSVTPENFLRSELSNGRRKAALGGIKQTLGYYVEDRTLPRSFRGGLESLDETLDWHIQNTGNIDYGGLY